MSLERLLASAAEASDEAYEEEEEYSCYGDAPDGCSTDTAINKMVGVVWQALSGINAVALVRIRVIAHDAYFTVSELKLYYTPNNNRNILNRKILSLI